MDAECSVTSSRCSSLPPLVKGEVHGYLTLKVDHVLWTKKPPSNIVVLAHWWGENRIAVFRPDDVKRRTEFRADKFFTYEIRTRLSLFREYLHDCENLQLFVVHEHLSNLIGLVKVTSIERVIYENTYQSYFPIVNASGTVGELHVSLQLQEVTAPIASPYLQELCVVCKQFKSFMDKNKKNCGCNKHCSLKIGTKAKCSTSVLSKPSTLCGVNKVIDGRHDKITSTYCASSGKSSSTLNDILAKAVKLREAMVKSILEDDDLLLLSGRSITHNSNSSQPSGISSDSYGKISELNRIVENFFGQEHNRRGKETSKTLHTMSPVKSASEFEDDLDRIETEFALKTKVNNSGVKEVDHMDCSNTNSHTNHESNSVCKREQQSSIQLSSGELKVGSKKTLTSSKSALIGMCRLHVEIHKLILESSNAHRVLEATRIPKGTFFVEFELPKGLVCPCKGNQQRPVDNNIHRFCSRKQLHNVIQFEKTANCRLVPDDGRLRTMLESSHLIFRIYCRHLRQRSPSLIGTSELALSTLLCLGANKKHDLPVMPIQNSSNNDQPLGILVTVVELISGICAGKDKHFKSKDYNDVFLNHPVICTKEDSKEVQQSITKSVYYKGSDSSESTPGPVPDDSLSEDQHNVHSGYSNKLITDNANVDSSKDCNKELTREHQKNNSLMQRTLHVLLQVYKGCMLEEMSSHLVCRMFWKKDTSVSSISQRTKTPVYRFHEIMQILLDDDFLKKCHENFMTIEVWGSNKFFGLAKLTLEPFYSVLYGCNMENTVIANKLPVVGVDGWVDVTDPRTGLRIGQILVTLAIGTKDQIDYIHKNSVMSSDVSQYSLKNITDTPLTSDTTTSLEDTRTGSEAMKNANVLSVPVDSFNLKMRVDESICFQDSHPTSEFSITESYVQKQQESNPVPCKENMTHSERTLFLDKNSGIHDTTREISGLHVATAGKYGKTIHKHNVKLKQKSGADKSCKNFKNFFPKSHLSSDYKTANFNPERSKSTTHENFDLPSDTPSTATTAETVFRAGSDFNSDTTAEYVAVCQSSKSPCQKSVNKQFLSSISSNVNSRVQNQTVHSGICDSRFSARVDVENALHLPVFKKNKKRVQPSCYVTFTASTEDPDHECTLSTPVAWHTASPVWNWSCDTWLSAQLLKDETKQLIFKIWAHADGSENGDSVIGFTSVDLTVLLFGMPWISGWFSIIDFTGNDKGQIKISITPTESLTRFSIQQLSEKNWKGSLMEKSFTFRETLENSSEQPHSVEISSWHKAEKEYNGRKITKQPTSYFIPSGKYNTISTSNSPQNTSDEIGDGSLPFLSNALKRKMSELDEITQRLKQRLSSITQEDENSTNWEMEDVIDQETEQWNAFGKDPFPENAAVQFVRNNNTNFCSSLKSDLQNNDKASGLHSESQEENSTVVDTAFIELSRKQQNESISEGVLNSIEDRLKAVNVADNFEEMEGGFDTLTDYIMDLATKDLELENVFNPMLFQHLLNFSVGKPSAPSSKSTGQITGANYQSGGNSFLKTDTHSHKTKNSGYSCPSQEQAVILSHGHHVGISEQSKTSFISAQQNLGTASQNLQETLHVVHNLNNNHSGNMQDDMSNTVSTSPKQLMFAGCDEIEELTTRNGENLRSFSPSESLNSSSKDNIDEASLTVNYESALSESVLPKKMQRMGPEGANISEMLTDSQISIFKDSSV